MDGCSLSMIASIIACVLAKQVNNREQILLLSLLFNQISNVLETIAAQDAICNDNKDAENAAQSTVIPTDTALLDAIDFQQ